MEFVPPPRGVGDPSAIIDRVHEWKVMGDSVVKGLVDCFSEIESREENLRSIRESFEMQMAEKRRELDCLHEGKMEALKLREEELRSFEMQMAEKKRELDCLHEGKMEALKLREEELRSLRESFEMHMAEKKRELDCLHEGKGEELRLREEELRSLSESFEMQMVEKKRELNCLHEGKREALKLREEELRLREEKLDEQLQVVNEHIQQLEVSQAEVDGLRVKECGRLKEIDKRERELEKRLGEFEKREKEFDAFCDGKSRDLALKEEILGKKKAELVEEVRLANEKQTLGYELIERLQAEVDGQRVKECERLKEIDNREMELEKRLGEFEMREKEFDAFYDGKSGDLALKEEILEKEKSELVKEVRLANEKISEKQKLGYVLIERLELGVKMLGEMKMIMAEKFKELESREEAAHESLTASLNEAELIRESVEKRFKELESIEKELTLSQEDKTKKLESAKGQLGYVRTNEAELRREKSNEQQKSKLQNKPEEKKQEHELQQVNLVSCKKEHDDKELDSVEKSLSCIRESTTQSCAKENLALSEPDQPHQQSVGTDAGLVADKEQHVCKPREVDVKEKLNDVHFKEQGSKQQMVTDACLTTKQDEAVDSKLALHKNHLVALIRFPEKDLELMGRNFYKILSISPDPAKLVIEALHGFEEIRLGTLDMERRATILLLDQLAKLSPKIQPCVKQAATKLACLWKSETSSAERPTEALAFLHLLAVYGISSSFDRSELLSFLKLADKHKHNPNLCRTLGLADRVPGYIKVLMNEKHYLLASTYVFEYQLQHMFSQSEILNYYASHSKKSANALCRREHNTSAAQANAAEIAALRLGIEHIVKYGLESDYSPITFTARIKQLEASQAGLRRRIPSPSDSSEKHGRCNRSQETSKWARRKRKRCREAKNSDAFSNNCSSPDWRQPPQHQSSQMKTSNAAPAYPWEFVNLAPFPQSAGPRKRPRTNTWVKEGGAQVGKVASQC
ncbi:FRIGIDA-like protein 5 isoform X2 [Salvia splendens]|uniref:FRIGIDA-like protein 5 isoform X2 n=1 Tax=Salvia splendens TaxID=180675 RepID=UPI001C26B766|nr:FRIGIDA-like protein 5 isoform X2 [Salvia splendens]